MAPTAQLISIADTATIRDALTVIDANGLGIAFVVDAAGRMVGVCADGDVRRAFLAGATLESPVGLATQRHYVSAPVDAPQDEIFARLTTTVRIIPLLDGAGRPVDYASINRSHVLPVMEPSLTGNELAYLIDCVKSGWISSQGPYVKRFEAEFARYLGVPEAVAVANGTVALHLALAALGIGAGDEVIVPDLTFAASINAILYTGATPVLADVDRESWTIDTEQLPSLITARTRAIMPVHLYGQSAAMDRIVAIARAHDVLVVEDAAEALGASHGGRMLGSLGDAGTFSFFGNKLITTGEGGMVVFRDPAAAARARVLRDHGMDPGRRYWHAHVGYNYRLTNMQAAIGTAQMERIAAFIEAKDDLAERYRAQLGSLPGVGFASPVTDSRSVCWLFSMTIDPSVSGLTSRELADRLKLNGVESRPLFYPLHVMPPYAHLSPGRTFPNADWLSENGISLPSAVTLTAAEIDHICASIQQILSTRRVQRSMAGV